jgi:hypothetical protein
MTRLKVHSMHKLLKKTMNHELSYCKLRLNVHNMRQLLKMIIKQEAQLSMGYSII